MRGHELTHREREALKLIADGNSTKELAVAMGVSIKTVELTAGTSWRS